MDFKLTDEQLAVSEAAGGVFSGLVDAEKIAAVESSTDRIDRDLWKALADADLLGLAIPEADGGAGYGLMELCLLLEAQGNVVAPVPLWSTLVLGALPLARFGSEAQRAAWLPGVVAGDVILTAALSGAANSPTSMPAVRASASGDGFVLHGTELAVPQAHLADRIVLPARTEDGGVLLALLDPAAPGVTLERAVTTNREVHPHVHLADVTLGAGDVLVGPDGGRAALDVMLVASTVGLCALQVGVCEAALTMTAAYLNSRQQFGRPLSTFQGTMLRAADAAIDIEADARHMAERGVALRHRPRRRRRGPGGQVAGLGAGAEDRARHPAPARGHGGGHLLPHPPLLPLGQADRAAPGGPERAAGEAGGRHRGAGVGPCEGGIVSGDRPATGPRPHRAAVLRPWRSATSSRRLSCRSPAR